MYCKFCGSVLTSNATKCMACGAKIDLNDGGQSFFDDNELSAWQNDNIGMSGNGMPRTNLLTPTAGKGGYGRTQSNPGLKINMRHSGTGMNTKKLWIFGIASSLTVIAIVVGIILIFTLGGDGDKASSPGGGGAAGQIAGAQSSDSKGERKELKNITIVDENGATIKHPAPVFSVNDTIYLSIDYVLVKMGYEYEGNDVKNKDIVIFKHGQNKKEVKYQKDSNNVWVGGKFHTLSVKLFNEGANTYVPIKEFLVKLNYEVEWQEDKKLLTLINKGKENKK